MKYECGMMRDLIPLVKDGMASEQSAAAVALHIAECPACREIFEADAPLALPAMDESAREEISKVTRYQKRVKRRRRVFIALLSLLAAALVTVTGLLTVPFLMLFANPGESYETRDIAEYGDFSGHIEAEEGFFSALAIFPAQLPPSAKVEDYYYYCNNGFLDNSYQLYLVCIYSEADFAAEKDRLETLTLGYDDVGHSPVVTDEGFEYPAVVTMFNNQNSFEYALLDDATRMIAYIYAQSMGIKSSVVPPQHRPHGFQPPEEALHAWGGFDIYAGGYPSAAWRF